MKNFILLLGIIGITCGCSSEDSDTQGKTPIYKIHDNNIVGVWKNGSDCFISFSSDKFNSALLSNKFIDEGDYSINGDTILVNNKYFNQITKYVVNNINDNYLSVTVTYEDRWEGKKSVCAQFEKTSDTPCSKSHNLIGKTFLAQYATNYGSQNWNKEFFSYNTASCTRTDVAKSTPSTFYYVYLPPKIYFYVIQYGMFYYDTIRYDNVTLDNNNQIKHMDYLYGQELYTRLLN